MENPNADSYASTGSVDVVRYVQASEACRHLKRAFCFFLFFSGPKFSSWNF